MGCLFSKKPFSTSHHEETTTTSTRVHQLRHSSSNGIIRVPKLSLKTGRKPHSTTDQSSDGSSHQLRIKPPPLAPPPSPSPITSPRNEITEPPTPENERLPLHVQYAEDLEPITSNQSGKIESAIDSKHSQSKVSVSNVTLKTNMNGLRGGPKTLQDISIEELDTEIDDTNKFRGSRFNFSDGEQINPAVTDILLPRRKDKVTSGGKDTRTDGYISQNTAAKSTFLKKKSLRPDTPMITSAETDDKKFESDDMPLKIEEVCDADVTASVINGNEMGEQKSKEENRVITTLEVTNKREENIVTFDMSIDERFSESTPSELDNIESKAGKIENRTRLGTLTDIRVDNLNDVQTNQQSKPVLKTMNEQTLENDVQISDQSKSTPKTLYEQDLEKTRLKRKRKRPRNRKSDYTPRSSSGLLADKDNDGFFGGSLKSLLDRADSGTSMWTLDSKQSMGSTETLKSFDMDIVAENPNRPDRYSYINSGSTPISFKTYGFDENTEIIDLEDNGDLNDGSWLSDDTPKTEEQFDVWYHVKPYDVISAGGRNDAGVVKNNEPTRSELNTKRKLMYSRFARRPKSESMMRMAGKPPVPPSSQLRKRPTSDTKLTPRHLSKYYTTDLDIH